MGDMLELGSLSPALHAQTIKEALDSSDTLIGVGAITGSCLNKANKSKNIFTCKTSSEAREILFNKVGVDHNDLVLVKGSRGMKMEEVFNF
jgi:UDP-N-acetylmuramyl pentapeptide synthase